MARIQLADPNGEIFSVDEEEAEAARAANGLVDATPEQVAAFQAKQAPAPVAPDAGAPDAGAEQAKLLERAPTVGRVQLINPTTRELFSVDEGEAEAAQAIHGLVPATPDDVKQFTLQERFGTSLGDKMDAYASTMIGVPAELAEAASKRGLFQPTDPLTGAPIGPAAIDPLSGKLRPGVAQEAEKLVPFVYTPSEKAKREANPNWAAAGAVVPDLATALLIPQLGVGGALLSSIVSGAISEAGASVIDGDEFSVLDMGLAGGTALAMEGIGAVALKAAFGGAGKAKNYIDSAIDRAERLGADDALAETDPVKQLGKLQRNDEAVYQKVQTEFDKAMERVDQKLVDNPDVMFSPKALKSTVSGNVKIQEDEFLDVAVKLEHAADMLDVPAVASARDVLQGSLGKKSHEMFAALHSAKRELEALGSESLVVQDAIETLDGALRSERTWGKAAKTYASTADDGADVVGSWNVRELGQRDALEARLDKARTRATATGDRDLAKQVQKAERALERADKVTGSRLIAGTTPDDVAALKKKVEDFEKRGPKLAKELSRSMQRLEKRLGEGSIPRATEDDALDYIAARVHGIGKGRDPIKDVLKQAEKHLEDLKAKGASPMEVGRAQADINAVRAASDEVNEIPKAAKRVRDWEAHPARLKERAAEEANAVVTDELENALQPILHGGGAAIGGAVFGVPGYIGGYLLGRAANKGYGKRIASYIWGKARKNIAAEAVKSPGQALTGALGAVGGMVLGHGSPAAVATGFYAGRKAGQVAGDAATGLFRRGKAALSSKVDDVTRATPKKPPGAPPAAPPSTPKPTAKAAEGVTVTARPFSASSGGDLDVRALNKATKDLRTATKQADQAAIAAAQKAYDEALAAVKPLGNPPRNLGQKLLAAVKKDPSKALGAALAPVGALSAAQNENSETAGAAAASAGLLLLFLPRGMGLRAAREALENTVRRAVQALPPGAAPNISRAINQVDSELVEMLRKAAREDWSADDLVRAQSRRVHDAYVERFGSTISEIEGGDAFVRAEMWNTNATLTAQDPELQQLYSRATTATEDAAARAAAPAQRPLTAPQLQRADNISAMSPETLRQQILRGQNALGEAERDELRGLFGEMAPNLQAMARVYIEGGADPAGRIFQTGPELLAAQRAMVMGRVQGSAGLSNQALEVARLEIVRLNNEVTERVQRESIEALSTESRAAPPSPRAQAMDRTSELQPDRLNRLEHDAAQAMTALPQEGRTLIGQLFRGAGDEVRALTEQFFGSGLIAARTADDLFEAQMAVLTRHIESMGIDVPSELADAAENAVRQELRRYNAAAALEARRALPAPPSSRLARDEPFSSDLTRRAHEARQGLAAREGRPPVAPAARHPFAPEERRIEVFRREAANALPGLERRAAALADALPQQSRSFMARLNRHAGDEVRQLRSDFLAGTPTAEGEVLRTPSELIRAQMAAVDNHWRQVGPEGMERDAYNDLRNAMQMELQRANDQALVDAAAGGSRDAQLLQRVREAASALRRNSIRDRNHLADEIGEMMRDDFSPADADRISELIQEHGDELMNRALGRAPEPPAAASPAASERSYEAFFDTGRQSAAGSITNRTHAAFDQLMRGGMSAREVNQIHSAFNSADAELREMLTSFVNDEPHISGRGSRFELGTREELIRQQLRVVREHIAGELGVPADTIFGAQFDDAIALELERRNGHVANEIHFGGRHAQNEAQRATRRAERAAAEDAGRLKNPDEMIDEHPTLVEGIPTDAAVRLDDALQPEMQRLQTHWEETAVYDQAQTILNERAAGVDDIARQFVRDNPGLISEEDALAYARRRLEEIGTVEAEDWVFDGGFARQQILPPVEREAVFESMREAVEEMADDGIGNDWDSLRGRLQRSGMNEREMHRAERVWDARESELDTAWNQRTRQNEAPPSSEPQSSGRSGSYSSGVNTEDIGLPDIDVLNHAGMHTVEINHQDGIQNVFGRDLTVEEVRGIFSLDHLKKYADDTAETLETTLEVNGRSVSFSGKVGSEFKIQTTYRQGYDGLEISYNFLHIPQALEGTGAAKKLISDMVAPLESLGAKSVTLSSAWIGMYAWPKLGARPTREAELAAFDAFERALRMAIDPSMANQAATHVMGKIDNLRDLADTWLPVDLVKDRMPELRQGWEELMNEYRHSGVRRISFEDACMRTSRSGNQQFLAGKYFLLKQPGPWNSDLSFDIAPGTPWYEEFKGRVGLSAGVGAIGLGMWELAGAFHGTEAVAHGAGAPKDEAGGEEMPPEVQAYMDQQTERDDKVEGVREKLGYVKSQGATAMQTAARALASPLARERRVPVVAGVTSSQGVARFLGRNDSLRDAYEEKRETLDKMAKDPMALVDELTEGLSELQDTAPDLHEKMVAQTYKIVAYLQGKLPSTIGTSLARPNGSPPSDLALRQFALYYSAATEPGSVLADLSNNRARREQVDTLREVWPDAYTQLKTSVVTEMAKGRPTVAQRQRLDLLFDFGDALDTGLSSRLMAMAGKLEAEQIQAAEAKGGGGGQGAPGKVPTRRTQPSVSGASATGSLSHGPAGGLA